MPSYDIFGKFYDAVMGDRAESAERLRGFIRKASPNAKNVLELACGTGSVLKHLSKHYDVWGLDLSKQMLSIARKKVPQAKISRQNMVTFHCRGWRGHLEHGDRPCCQRLYQRIRIEPDPPGAGYLRIFRTVTCWRARGESPGLRSGEHGLPGRAKWALPEIHGFSPGGAAATAWQRHLTPRIPKKLLKFSG